eukprot:scaffold2055_cov30-Tisochrysis_lutea.AAC.4
MGGEAHPLADVLVLLVRDSVRVCARGVRLVHCMGRQGVGHRPCSFPLRVSDGLAGSLQVDRLDLFSGLMCVVLSTGRGPIPEGFPMGGWALRLHRFVVLCVVGKPSAWCVVLVLACWCPVVRSSGRASRVGSGVPGWARLQLKVSRASMRRPLPDRPARRGGQGGRRGAWRAP